MSGDRSFRKLRAMRQPSPPMSPTKNPGRPSEGEASAPAAVKRADTPRRPRTLPRAWLRAPVCGYVKASKRCMPRLSLRMLSGT